MIEISEADKQKEAEFLEEIKLRYESAKELLAKTSKDVRHWGQEVAYWESVTDALSVLIKHEEWIEAQRKDEAHDI
jgi:hypothetical protein